MKHTIGIIAFVSTVLVSCEEMSLDPNVENTFGDKYTWKFGNYAEGVLMNAYANIPGRFNSYNNNFLDVATDNAVTNSFGTGIHNASAGSISAHANPIASWNQPYDQFRNIHLFLENGLGENVDYNIASETTDSLIRLRLKGEAYFLRAWWGFQLLQNFGGKTSTGTALGYPIVTRTFTEEEFLTTNDVRNTYEECVSQILADIDTAVYYLPVEFSGNHTVTGIAGLGRADDQVALALKSRVLLYAASPAYQDDDITQITGMGQFVVTNLSAYEAKWVVAAQAAQEALNTLTGGIPGLKTADFTANNTPQEFVWRKYHSDRNLESWNYPPLHYGNGATSPSQNLVDAFPAANGYPIEHPSANYDAQDPYSNRDPRLALNVLHNGQGFIQGPLETFVGGKDSRAVHHLGTRTGYYLRKWLNIEDMLNPENPINAHHYHALIRKTEVLLNFAEASNEAVGPENVVDGCDRSAIDVIKQIRSNAGVGNAYVDEVAAQGKDAFRELIQNERRIELAFENQRYFDLRRWLLPLNEPVTGMKITKNDDSTLTYEEVVVEERRFNDVRYYYLPIPFDEQAKSPNLINNLGW